jgi:hypothetical protein
VGGSLATAFAILFKPPASERGLNRICRLLRAVVLGPQATVPTLSGAYDQQSISQMLAGLNSYEELYLDEYAARYFKQRLVKAEILNLLKQHRNLTGKWLVITSIDYDHQKFKVQQV